MLLRASFFPLIFTRNTHNHRLPWLIRLYLKAHRSNSSTSQATRIGTNTLQTLPRLLQKKVGSVYRARKLLLLVSIIYLYQMTIHLCMENYCHYWANASTTSLWLLGKIKKKKVFTLIVSAISTKLQFLSDCRNVVSLCTCFPSMLMFTTNATTNKVSLL